MRRARLLVVVGSLLLAGPCWAQDAQDAGTPPAASPAKKKTPKAAPAADAGQAQAAPAAVPEPVVLLMLIRTSLIALDQANRTNNYTVLRDVGGPQLQRFTAAQLSDLFANLRNQHADLSPVAVITPQVSRGPEITPQGLLAMSGVFATQPLAIQFQLVFQPVGGRWQLYGLNVALAQAATQAPQAAVSAPAPKATGAQRPKPAAPAAQTAPDAPQ